MNSKQKVHNLIILDESGSMHSIKETIIEGFNEVVQTIKGIGVKFPEQEHYISFVSFNGLGYNVHHKLEPVAQLKELKAKKYQPNGFTPLYDAMGNSLTQLKQHLENQTDYNVLVTILTDGEENSSKEFSRNAIKNLVEELKEKGWTFTYMGTDHDVTKVADSLSINNSMYFDKKVSAIKAMFEQERRSREMFSQKIKDKEDTSSGYFGFFKRK